MDVAQGGQTVVIHNNGVDTVFSLPSVCIHQELEVFSRVQKTLILAILGVSLLLQQVAFGQNEPDPEPGDENPENQEQTEIDRREATELAQENYPGRVLSIRLVDSVWRVRMDNEGTIFNVHVNAEDGEVSRPD